jgi:hypothetical protein
MVVGEEHLEAEYLRRTGIQRRMTCVQRPYCWNLARTIVCMADKKGLAPNEEGLLNIDTTWPQLASALGFPTKGMNVSQIADRYETRIKRSMRYLIAAGYVDGWDVKREGREPTGILVRVPAGVAQLVRAAES